MFGDRIYITPFGGRNEQGEWVEGELDGSELNEKFQECKTLDECIAITNVDGLKLFFEHLKSQQ